MVHGRGKNIAGVCLLYEGFKGPGLGVRRLLGGLRFNRLGHHKRLTAGLARLVLRAQRAYLGGLLGRQVALDRSQLRELGANLTQAQLNFL